MPNPELIFSILIPPYNEEELIEELLRRVRDAPLPDGFQREIIVVDDCSADDSGARVSRIVSLHPGLVQLHRQQQNRGKGAAVRTALRFAAGNIASFKMPAWSAIREYQKLLRPLIEGRADTVYGSRFAPVGERRVLNFWHAIGNMLLTTACNMASDLKLTDIETCYKAFRTSLIQSIPLLSVRPYLVWM